jgi:hypothetical protein
MEAVTANSSLLRLSNAYLVNPEDGQLTLGTASVWVNQDSGKIVHIAYDEPDDQNDDTRSLTAFHSRNNPFSEAQQLKLDTCPVIDLDQAILSPGLIDIQINGCFGVDFSDWAPNDALGRTAEEAYLDGLEKVAKDLACTGVTSFLPTVIVSDHPHMILKSLYPKLVHNRPHSLKLQNPMKRSYQPSKRLTSARVLQFSDTISRARFYLARNPVVIPRTTCAPPKMVGIPS